MSTDKKVTASLWLGALALVLSIVALATGGAGSATVEGPDAFYLAQAKENGMRKAAFETCVEDDAVMQRITTDSNEAASIGGQGTPFNVIKTADGVLIPVPGAYPFEAFADIITRSMTGELTEEELANAYTIDDIRPFDAETDFYRGDPNAEITIFEWSDFECPYCSRVHTVLEDIVDTFPNVNWVYRQMPLSFHPQAEPAAKAAICIGENEGNDAFWSFADTVFTDQTVLQ